MNNKGWLGGEKFIKIKRGSGGTNNSAPVGRRKTRFLPRLMAALAKGKRAKGIR